MQKQIRALILKNVRLLKSTWIGSLIYMVVLPIILMLIVYVMRIKMEDESSDSQPPRKIRSKYYISSSSSGMYHIPEGLSYLDVTANKAAKQLLNHTNLIYDANYRYGMDDEELTKAKVLQNDPYYEKYKHLYEIQYYTDAKELDKYLYGPPAHDDYSRWRYRFAIEHINDTAYTLMYKHPDMNNDYDHYLVTDKFRQSLTQIFGHIQFDQIGHKSLDLTLRMNDTIRKYDYQFIYLQRQHLDSYRLRYSMFAYILAIALLLVFVSATSSLLKEKKDRVLILTRLNGMKLFPYLISHAIVYYVLSLIPAILAIILGFAMSFPLFRYPVVPILVMLTSGLSAVGFSMLAAVFLPANRMATVMTMSFISITGVAAALTFIFEVDHVAFYLVPFYSVAHLLSLFSYYGYYSVSPSVWFKGDKIGGLLIHLIQPFLYYLLATYFFQVYNQKGTGISRPWLFPLYSLVKWINKNIFKDKKTAVGNASSSPDLLASDNPAIDEDVKREMQNAYDMKNKNNPLILKNVMMTYPDGKTAVNGVSLTVENGIVFGLLGPNGAGKTSLINIMAGVHKHTSGEVLIANYDIRKEPQKVYENIGYCPQHDIYWSKLSVVHHIEFFLQLKGTCKTKEEEKAKLEDLLNLVGLQKQRHQLACSLSGGEKRRLSLALAFCGNGRVIFLDEPTTGLDPEVRTMIWKIIEDAKQGRLLILTTHSMEEAEKLSDKITIMAQGSMKCFGSPQYLKQKFGGKIMINVSSSKENLSAALKSIIALYPNEMKIFSQSGSIGKIQFNGDKVEIPVIYEKIEELIHSSTKSTQPIIYDWGFDQPSLAEVFLNIVSETEAAA